MTKKPKHGKSKTKRPKKHEKFLTLDMSFDEALKRLAKVPAPKKR